MWISTCQTPKNIPWSGTELFTLPVRCNGSNITGRLFAWTRTALKPCFWSWSSFKRQTCYRPNVARTSVLMSKTLWIHGLFASGHRLDWWPPMILFHLHVNKLSAPQCRIVQKVTDFSHRGCAQRRICQFTFCFGCWIVTHGRIFTTRRGSSLFWH